MLHRRPTRSFAFVLFVAAFGLPSAAQAQSTGGPPPADAMPDAMDGFEPSSEAEAEAIRTLVQFGRMWEDEDMDTFDRIIAPDADMVVIGTDAREFIVGYDTFRRARAEQFASFENVEFNVISSSLKLSESGTVAWFTEEFDLYTVAEGAPVSLEDLRLSGVMERRDGQWRIVQLHTSVPVPGRAAEY